MDRSQLLRGTLDAAALAVVAEQDGYGYDVLRRLRAAGLSDAPWPPVYPKQPDEPPRVAPSRARKGPQ